MNLGTFLKALSKGLVPFYFIHSDEELLLLEAVQAIRDKARAEGFSERKSFVSERGFDWSDVRDALSEMSLFGDKKITEVHLPKGLDKAATLFLQGLEPLLNADSILLLTLPHLPARTLKNSAFNSTLTLAQVVDIPKVQHEDMPLWLRQRLESIGYQVEEDALLFLIMRTEGNLLAANQELQKLPLLYPPKDYPVLTQEVLQESVADVARYDPYKIYQPLLSGDAVWLAQMLQRLEEEGSDLPPLLWAVSHEVRTLLLLKVTATAEMKSIKMRSRIWGDHDKLMTRALPKLSVAALERALSDLLEVDRIFKGVPSGRLHGSAWVVLRSILLRLCKLLMAA